MGKELMNVLQTRLFPATKARCDSTKVSAYDTEEDDDEVVFQKMANREATKRKILKEVVNTKLFPKVKFIPDESYLKSGGKVMEIVCEALELSGSDADKYWKDVSKWVPKYLNKKRNNVMGVIKESLECK